MPQQRNVPVAWLLFILPILFLFLASPAPARQEATLPGADGRPLLRYVFFEEGESFEGEMADWTLEPRHRDSVLLGGEYIAALLGSVPRNVNPAYIHVLPQHDDNCAAASVIGPSGYTQLTETLLGLSDGQDRKTFVIIGDDMGEYSTGPLSQLPGQGESMHLTATIVHEMFHALGITTVTDWDAQRSEYVFDEDHTFSGFLVDSYGKPGGLGKSIGYDLPLGSADFILTSEGYAFFQGDNTYDVVGRNTVFSGQISDDDYYTSPQDRNPNKITGVPINGYEDDEPELSHIELRNGFLSHQLWRNYTVPMEAELAILQDLGLAVDRKNFYGFSIYADNSDVEVTQGYFARNAQGTEYLPGQYNTTPLGVGLHIYGTSNTVTMRGDVLSSGYGGAGIRVDGWSNTLIIAPESTIHSNGAYGTALMVAYGKDHVITQQGELAALGPYGVGARFDFGDNTLGAATEERGSYIHTYQGYDLCDIVEGADYDFMLEELKGPLAERFDLTGSLAGQQAAVYIADNAFVRAINIMRGASLSGDIISEWDPYDTRVRYAGDPEDLMTALTFGYLPMEDGSVSPLPDPDFTLAYQGDITGPASLRVEVAGGTLRYLGTADVASFSLYQDATLAVAAGLGNGVQITAQEISLAEGSTVRVDSAGFSYGERLEGAFSVLRLNAADSLENEALVQGDGGKFRRGFYDYRYGRPIWEEDEEGMLSLNVPLTRRSVSRARAGHSAITAPQAVLVRDAVSPALHAHTAGRFALLRGQAASGAALPDADDFPTAGAPENARSEEERFLQGRAGAWISSSYAHTRQHRRSRYTLEGFSWTAGVDRRLTDNLFLGAALSYARPQYRSSDADVDAETLAVSLYAGALLPGDIALGVFGSYGRGKYDQERRVHGARYDSDYASDDYRVGASLARTFPLTGQISLRPFVEYEYLHQTTEQYDEGSGPYALSVGSRSSSLHRLGSGAEVLWRFGGGAELGVSAFYSGLHGDRTGRAAVAFTGDPAGTPYYSRGDSLDENALGARLSLTLPLTENISCSGGYSFVGGRNSRTQEGHLSLHILF